MIQVLSRADFMFGSFTGLFPSDGAASMAVKGLRAGFTLFTPLACAGGAVWLQARVQFCRAVQFDQRDLRNESQGS